MHMNPQIPGYAYIMVGVGKGAAVNRQTKKLTRIPYLGLVWMIMSHEDEPINVLPLPRWHWLGLN